MFDAEILYLFAKIVTKSGKVRGASRILQTSTAVV
jgi:hypothetical protein